ncbi:MAG: Gfo/Idh/MocA family oxidoreductase, partial [Planctomycetia bacterium]|nr:Gfo/Idh/MocA family oxidoreductase [Planctomycetia bacterium]
MKARFIIVGSGWRAMYYVRIAKALPEKFELGVMLCRTQEKAEKISQEMAIHTTTSIEECEQYHPDFVVVAVNKSSIYEVSKEWMAKGYTVLCETPAALKLEQLQQLWRLREEKGYKLCVAEQYFRYPSCAAMLSVLEKKVIGEPYNVTLSLAHDYHGASLIRKILKVTDEAFCVSGRRYIFPVTETASRYEKFSDGRVSDKKRDRISFEFENGKAAFYDFCSEQYRSPIRSNYINVQGVRGEMKDEKV